MDKPVKQLIYDKTDPKSFYPKNLMANILDGEDGDNLYIYLSKFNHINVGQTTDKITARKAIPILFRHKGLYITFYINDETITEYFDGENENAIIEEQWILDDYWKVGVADGEGTAIPKFSAEVVEVTSPEKAYAKVILENNNFKFSFGLPRGLDGAIGPQGPQGPAGDTAIFTKTVFAFKASDDKPEKPTGGFWDYESNIVTYPEGWSSAQEGLTGIIWMSIATFAQDGSLDTDWSDPIRISGENGTNGEDGTNIEFIYKLTTTSYETPSKPDNNNEDKYVPEGWTDHPTGISEEYKVEWLCTRQKDSDGIWGDWEGPSIWSKWGENGMDGDGGEYIYKTTYEPTPPERPTDVSQEDDFVPDGWTDNPTGVDAINQWEWVCYRKYSNNTWGSFSSPALWAKYGEQGTSGDSVRIMYTKTDNSSIVPECIKNNINPGSEWGLGIPSYSSTEAIWAIQGIINYRNELVGTWEGPYLITGVNGKDGVVPNYTIYVFKQSDETPDTPTSNDINPGNGWVDYPTGEGTWWMCVGVVNGVTNTVSSWGTPIKITSKDGINGVGISKIEEFYGLSNNIDTPPSEWYDKPQIPTEELDFAWNYEKITYDNETTSETKPRIYSTYVKSGKDGISITSIDNYYKLTNNENVPSVEDEGWSTEILTPNDINKYLWNYEVINYNDENNYNTGVRLLCRYGQDGGFYQLAQEYYGLSNNINTEPEDGDWVTSPVTPNAENRYAWIREEIANSEGESKYTNARIYAFYTANGVDGVSVTNVINYYKLLDNKDYIGTTPSYGELTNSWSTEPLNVTKEKPYLYNVEVVVYSNENKTITSARIIANYSEDGEDGIDGTSTEFRFALGATAPELDNSAREPAGWDTTPPSEVTSGQYVWMIVGTIDSSNNLVGTWRGPTRISGEEGPQGATGPAGPAGPTGSQGISGIPGVTYANLYFSCNVDSNNNINYTDEFGKIYKALYDAYKTDPNFALRGGAKDAIIISTLGEEKINEYKAEIEKYKNIIETGQNPEGGEASEGEKQNAQYYYNYYNLLLNGAGTKFVSSIDELYFSGILNGETIKKKLASYIAFTQARVTIDTDGSYHFDGDITQWSEPQLLQGVNGLDGEKGETGVGINSIVDYYKLTSEYEAPEITTADSISPLSPNKENPYLWVREYITYSNGNHVWSSDSARLLTKYVENGADGVGISNTLTTYAISDSPTVPPSSWSTSIPIAGDNQYLWTKIEIEYTNGQKNISYSVVKNGLNANSIERIDEQYGLSNDDSTPPTQWEITPVTPTNENRYAWNKETTVFTDGTQQEGKPHIYALYLSDGVQGEPGETITDITNYYCASKVKETPKYDVSSNINIYNKHWYSNKDILNVLEEFLKQYPNKYYPYVYNYEQITLSSGTSYMTNPALISTYTENASGTINLYYVEEEITDSSDPWEYGVYHNVLYEYGKNNPNIDKISWDDINNLSDEEKIELFEKTVGVSDITYINYILLYKNLFDTFSTDLIGPNNQTDVPIYMISANVIVNSTGYKFAEETTQWSKPIRINSKNGTDGTNGTSVSSVEVKYTLSSSNTEIPSSSSYSWEDAVPTTTSEKPYIWQRTQYKSDSNVISTTYNLYTVGKDGTSVDNIVEYYCLSANNNTAPTTGWTTTVPTMTSVNRYLWNYEVFQMSDGSTKETSKRVIGVYGRDGEAVGGVGIKSIDEYYQKWIALVAPSFELDEETGTPTNPLWIKSFPTDLNSVYKYVWNVEVVTYTDGTYYVSEAVCIFRKAEDGADGADGAPGTDGADGVGIESITNYYLRSSLTSGVTTSTSGWTTSVLAPTVTQRYIWNYEKIVYTDGSTYNSPPHIIAGLGENGEDGEDGRKGQLVYPAGIYSNTTSYTTDQYKAPYVLDPSDGNFYVLNAQMTWLGTSQGNRTPAQDYTQNRGEYWLKFDAFEAIYAKIGIIANGLIGSSVFNGDWMFSQYGINYTGTQTTAYENFNPSWITLTKFTSSVKFVPKYAVNLKTGIVYIHGTGSSTNIPSLTINNGSIAFIKKSYSNTTNYTTKIINGNIVYHANGDDLLTISVNVYRLNIRGICIGTNASALVYSNGKYYKLKPADGLLYKRDSNTAIVDEDENMIICIKGTMYILNFTETVSSFTSWLNSIN